MQDKSRLDNQRGLDKEIQAKLAAKFDKGKAKKALDWVAAVTKKPVKNTGNIANDFHESLKDGYLLGLTIKKIGGAKNKGVKKSKWKKTKSSFPAREQIQKFVNYCKSVGMRETDVCTPNDLFDGDNLNNVLNHLFALNSIAGKLGYKGPTIEDSKMKFAEENKRNFDEETLRKGRANIPLLSKAGEKDDSKSNMDSYGIIKTNLVSKSAAVPLMSQGGAEADHNDFDSYGIVKGGKNMPKSVGGAVPRMNQGGVQVNAEKGFDAMGIVKLATAPVSSAVPRQNQGGVKVDAEKGFDAMGIVKVRDDGTLVSKKV